MPLLKGEGEGSGAFGHAGRGEEGVKGFGDIHMIPALYLKLDPCAPRRHAV